MESVPPEGGPAAAELTALELQAERVARGQRGWAAWWRFLETWAGLVVALLSAVAGATVLADEAVQGPVAALALAAAGLSAALGFLRPAERARKAETLAVLCEEFARDARYARLLGPADGDGAAARRAVVAMAARWTALRWDDLRDQLDVHDPGPGLPSPPPSA
ncbi:hypothetical protein HYE82_28800 [Streptomyces sp. BR123]|uniref:hypothetical protein n=1 Tax=Streptomyces sp. BR123 TaxID=2749828 RepID=UPI0015C485F5|nr:hypothetical protein [Streptomyces sp. BR123]NXY98300.1 hypothetical protein [Streptomyces sp. BR123]